MEDQKKILNRFTLKFNNKKLESQYHYELT